MNIRKTVKSLVPHTLFQKVEPAGHMIEAVFWNIVYGFPGRGTRAISVIGASNNTTTNHLVHNTEVCTVGNDFTWQPVAIFYNRRSRLVTATLNT